MSHIAGWMPNALFHSYPMQLLAYALVHFVWQGALIGVGAAVAFRRIPAREVRLRSAVALLAMATLMALPAATLLRVTAGPAALSAIRSARGQASIANSLFLSDGATKFQQERAVPGQDAPGRFDTALRRVRPWVLGVWLLGVVVGAAVRLGGWLVVGRIRRRARPAGLDWQDPAREAARLISSEILVPVLESEDISSPLVTGVLRPCILVPASGVSSPADAGVLDGETRVRVLAHELAHLRRRDTWKNLLQTWAEILYFFHPAVWYVSRRLRIEREHCCDELAAAASGGALPFAKALAALEQGRQPVPAYALGGSVALKRRIQRLLEAPERSSCSRRALRLAVIATAGLLLGCSVVPSTPKPEQKGGAHPETVFERLSQAYRSRDLDLYKACFTDDFIFESGEGGPTLTKDADAKTVGYMFKDPTITGIDYTFKLDAVTINEIAPDTWILEGVIPHAVIGRLKNGKNQDLIVQGAPNATRVTVRWDSAHGYRIAHWLERVAQESR